MKKYLKSLLLAIAAMTIGAYSSQAQTTADPIKREFRSIWLSAMGVDFGINTGVSGTKSVINNAVNTAANTNYTSVCFHVRPMADAIYASTLVPWSAYAGGGKRGQSPSEDLLEYAITQAHAKGIELYAWLNPYRWENATTISHNTPYDETWLENGWALSNTQQTVLNPGIPEVREHIVAVVKEILDNYDVDGIIFDDYFYPAGGMEDAVPDQALFEATRTSPTQSIENWRRENVNKMVQDVYDMIQQTKPDVRFGISPAGVAGANVSEYGFPSRPSGTSDWQYGTIYSDPLAWLYYGTVDFVSPQIYWPVDQANAPYGKLTEWWSKCAGMKDRHNYVSLGLSYTYGDDEYEMDVRLNRQYTQNNAPGFIMFAYNDITTSLNSLFLQSTTKYKALQPEVTWHEDKLHVFSAVQNVKKSSNTLSWTKQSYGNRIVKYSVYAVPDGKEIFDADVASVDGDGISSQYLLGVTYTNSYTIPSGKTSGYWYAVCVYDGFSKEWEPGFYGYTPKEPCAVATLVSPADGATVSGVFDLKWSDVSVDEYILELSKTSDFSNIDYTVSGNETSASFQADVLGEYTYYWRVRTRKTGYQPSVSETRSFSVDITDGPVATLLSPATGSVIDTEKSTKITFTWESDAADSYTMEASENADFSTILHSEPATAKQATCDASVYGIGTFYWRVKTHKAGYNTTTSEQVWSFTIESLPSAPQPWLDAPAHMSTIGPGSFDFVWHPQGNMTPDSYTIEVSGTSDWENIMLKANTTEPKYASSCEFFGVGTYYWRVTAHKEGYESAQSTWCMFQVDKVNTSESGYTMVNDGHIYSGGSEIDFSSLWIRSTAHNNFAQTGDPAGAFNRDFIAHGDCLYITGRTANSTSTTRIFLSKYNRYNGEYLGDLDLGMDANVKYMPCNDIMKDSRGDVYIANQTTSLAVSDRPIKLFKVNLETGDVSDAGSSFIYSEGGRVDHCAVYGNVSSGNYYLFAPLKGTKTVVRWKVTNGSVGTAQTTTLSTLYPENAADLGDAPNVLPVSDTEFYVDGHQTALTRYKFNAGGDATVTGIFGGSCDVDPGETPLNGGVVFSFAGHKFIGYAFAGNGTEVSPWKFQISDVNTNLSYASMTPYWTFPDGDNFGHASSGTRQGPMDYLPNANGTGTVYAYVPGSGIAAYTLRKQDWTGVEDGFADDTEVAIIVKGDYITLNAEASCITLCNLAGVTVAEGVGSSLYIDVTPGYYVVRAVVNGVPTTKPVVIR